MATVRTKLRNSGCRAAVRELDGDDKNDGNAKLRYIKLDNKEMAGMPDQSLENYENVNTILNSVFLDGRFQEQPLYLDLEDDLLEEICVETGETPKILVERLCEAVSETLTWGQDNIYLLHERRRRDWIDGGFQVPPPFTALLCVLTLAAEKMSQDVTYSSQNYYRRLCQILRASEDTQHHKVSFAGKFTLPFWQSLNFWLKETHYEFGRDTARQVNSWTYVSYAISQALVRETDRIRLKRLFVDFGFSQGENVSEPQMKLYLHEWMGGVSGPSEWLRKLWALPDLRERVVAAALHELETWDGGATASSTGSKPQKNLVWVATMKSFPKKQVNLFLTAGSADLEVVGRLTIASFGEFIEEAFRGCLDGLWLSNVPGLDIDFLEPRSGMSLDHLMMANFELHDQAGTNAYLRNTRPIVPLLKMESTPYFREVSRVTLNQPYIIFCHKKWRDHVCTHLHEYARSGFVESTSGQLNGVPPSWVMISGVEFNSIPEGTLSDNIQTLVPLAEGAGVHFDGGLKLGPNMWHVDNPPACYAMDDKGLLPCQLQTSALDMKAKTIAEQGPAGINTGFLLQCDADLDAGNFTVVAKRGRKTYQRDIGFRSANTPRKSRSEALAYVASEKYLDFSAHKLQELPDNAFIVRGMFVVGEALETEIKGSGADTKQIANYGDQTEADSAESRYLNTVSSKIVENCVVRAYHYWICQSYNGDAPRSSAVRMRCKDCGSSVLIADRKKQWKQKSASALSNKQQATLAGEALQRESEEQISEKTLFDALCYLGAGSKGTLESVLATATTDTWQVVTKTRDLIDLGHIDVCYQPNSNRLLRWSIAPPTLVVTDNETAYLAGFRSQSLVERFVELFKPHSSSVEIEEQRDAPPVILCSGFGLSVLEADSVLKGLKDPAGQPIVCVEAPGVAIASRMPSLDEISSKMNLIRIEDTRDLEKFEPFSGKWSRANDFDGIGGYRTSFAGRRYFFLDSTGAMKEGSYELVKIQAAIAAGVRLHQFDEGSSEFRCVLGCEPPGLFRRALVSCSGKLPAIKKGLTVYQAVDPMIAHTITSKLHC